MHTPLIHPNSQEQKRHLHKMSFSLKSNNPSKRLNFVSRLAPTPDRSTNHLNPKVEASCAEQEKKETIVKPKEKLPGFSLREFLHKNYQYDVNPNFFVENPLVFDRLRKYFLPKNDDSIGGTLDIAKKLLAVVCIDIRKIVSSCNQKELNRQSVRELIVIPGSLLFVVVETLKKESKHTIHPIFQWHCQKPPVPVNEKDSVVYETVAECLDTFEKQVSERNLDINKLWLILLPGCLPVNIKRWLGQYCETNKCINWQHVKNALIQKYDTHSHHTKTSYIDKFYNIRMKSTETIDEFINTFEHLRQAAEITDEVVLCEIFKKALFTKLHKCFKVYLTLISETQDIDLSKASLSIDFYMDLVRKTYYNFFTEDPLKQTGIKRPRPADEQCIFHPSTRVVHSTIDCRSLKKHRYSK